MNKIIIYIFIVLFALLLTGCKKQISARRIKEEDKEIELTLFAYNGKSDKSFGLLNFGHSFLKIKNNSEENIQLYDYVILPNEEMTFGTWPISTHFGLWFNLESNLYNYYNRYEGRVSISKNIDINDVSVINDQINKFDSWNVYKNCTYFAVNIWNLISKDDEKINLGITYSPSKLANAIKEFETYKTNDVINLNNNIGYITKHQFLAYALEAKYE